MKKSPTSSRGKPPALRSPSYFKQRCHLNVDRAFLPTSPPGERILSMSDIQEGADLVQNFKFSSKEVTDCMANWIAFLKVLRALSAAGSDLTESIMALSSSTTACKARADHFKGMWDHLMCATTAATGVIRSQTVASLQEVVIAPDIDSDQAEINQQVACSSLLRLVNLQFQFSASCYEWLSSIAGCQCCSPHTDKECEAVARCFTPRLHPSHVPQRRWSEAAASGDGKPHDSTLRRWSIPWKLALPGSNNLDRSRSTTPDTVWHNALASQEELQDVISLLSCRPTGHILPGVVLTKADGPAPENINRGLVHRGSWWGEGEELDVATLTSRKSSSSTDSSSCYSLHSRSSGSEELSHGQRSHLYSMWSGNDVPFIKLPESTENTDT